MIEHHDQMTINELMNVCCNSQCLDIRTCSRTTFSFLASTSLQVIVFISQTLDMIYKIKIVRYKSCMQQDPSSMHHQPLGSTLQLNFKFYKKTMVFMSNILKYLINQFLYKECNIQIFFIVSNHVLMTITQVFQKINQWHIHHSLI